MTDEELLAELMEEKAGVRASQSTSVHRVNMCLSCDFFNDGVCTSGNFVVFRQAADEAGSCPEDRW